MSLLQLLEKLEPQQGELVATLGRMVHYQLEAMSYCIGMRWPPPCVSPDARPPHRSGVAPGREGTYLRLNTAEPPTPAQVALSLEILSKLSQSVSGQSGGK